MRVQDVFEIKPGAETEHAPGVVVVLDTLVTREPKWLVGGRAAIRGPAGEELHLVIDEAKEHHTVNSLFFRDCRRTDIPLGGEITITLSTCSPEPGRAPALVS